MVYDRIAAGYQQGRALGDSELAAWRDAVVPFLPPRRPLTVLDVGAGTGIFARAWPTWCQCRVVALEPSAGMRAEAAGALSPESPRDSSLVAGAAEAIGLRDGCADVAWLSAVWHHVRDRRACVSELSRVLVPGAAVLMRGLFSDLGEVGWLRFFPRAEAARARFPSASDAAALFGAQGFEAAGAFEVDGRRHVTPREAAAWARRMRDADTLLGGFSDDDFHAGVAALEASASDRRLASKLALLVFVRR